MKKLITIIVGLAFITFIICTSCSNNKKTDSKNQRLARTEKKQQSISDGGFVIHETNGHGLVAAEKDLGKLKWSDAIKACDSFESNGYNDWHLPSLEELNQLFENKAKMGIVHVEQSYWSSSESENKASFKDFEGNGYQGYADKESELYVHPVRNY